MNNNLMAAMKAEVQQNAINHQQKFTQDDGRFIGMLFNQLKSIFPAWKVAFPDSASEEGARREWTRGLIDADCTSREKLARGMKMARLHDKPFLPSIGMFVAWCKPSSEELGLPSEEQAMRQTHEVGAVRHPAVIYAIRQIDDYHGFKMSNTEKAKKIWSEAWAKTIQFVQDGGVFPEPEIQVEHKPEPMSEEDLADALNTLDSILGGVND